MSSSLGDLILRMGLDDLDLEVYPSRQLGLGIMVMGMHMVYTPATGWLLI